MIDTQIDKYTSLNGDKCAWDFQKDGVRFVEDSNFNCLIADAMGLGKTVQTLLALRSQYEHLTPIYLIVPSATIYQWLKEFSLWTGPDSAFHIADSKSFIPKGFQVYISSRDILAKKGMVDKLLPLGIQTLVIDEIHGFKNQDSKRTGALLDYAKYANIPHKIFLSGTPIKNRASEYFTALHLLSPQNFPSYNRFVRTWLQPNEKGIYTRLKSWKINEFHDLISQWVIRREKADVLRDLPELQRNFIYRDIEDPELRAAYNSELDLFDNFLNAGKGINAISILGYLAKLRQITALAKTPLLIEYAKEFLELTDDKIALGIHHNSVKALLNSALAEFGPVFITGSEDPEEKFENVNKLRDDASHRVAIINILAGGQGVDGLQDSISNAVILERQWNFSDERQFEDRFHRPGQTNPVTIDYLLAAGTVDQYFTEIIEHKRKIFRETIGEDDYVFTSDENSLKNLARDVVSNRL